MTMTTIGHVVHYEGEYGGGAYVPSTIPSSTRAWPNVAEAMMSARPNTTVCVTPVSEVPKWAVR